MGKKLGYILGLMLIVFLISLFSNKYINKYLAPDLGVIRGRSRSRSISRGRGMIRGRSWSICWGRGMIRGRSWSISRGRSMVGGRSWSICRGRSMVAILVVLDKGLVRAGDSLILDISMVLLVLIHKVVNNLCSAVRELHSVLTYNKKIQSLDAIMILSVQQIMRGLRKQSSLWGWVCDSL